MQLLLIGENDIQTMLCHTIYPLVLKSLYVVQKAENAFWRPYVTLWSVTLSESKSKLLPSFAIKYPEAEFIQMGEQSPGP